MLDKEKLHRLVDNIDPDEYNKECSPWSTQGEYYVEMPLLHLQKEKSLEERLKEAGCNAANVGCGINTHDGITCTLYANQASIRRYNLHTLDDILNCSLDFDEIMSTIKYLENRK